MNFLKIKDTNKFELDSIERTIAHGDIIRSKIFLKSIYTEWYQKIKLLSNYNDKDIFLELGSGSGFIKQIMPNIITSDVFSIPGVDKIIYANSIPFNVDSINSIIMVDVLHHLSDVRAFFYEANRTLKHGGLIVMSEPWNSVWGKFIYSNFHHEPFQTQSNWEINDSRPLSAANGALPWIIFERDRLIFESEFPNFSIEKIEFHTPFRYLLSGGVSMKQIVPNFSFSLFTKVDNIFASKYFSMFAYIVIRKK